MPKDRFWVFFASSPAILDEMLHRENAGLVSNSTPAELLLSGKRRVSAQEMKRLEAELEIVDRKRIVSNSFMPVPTGHLIHAPSASSFSVSLPPTESGPGGDHDTPYVFTPAATLQEAMAWMKLLARVQRGELEP